VSLRDRNDGHELRHASAPAAFAEIVMPAKAGIQYSGHSRIRRLLDSGSRFAALPRPE